MRYQLSSHPFMADPSPAFAIIETDDKGDIVSIVPHQNARDDESLMESAQRLIENFSDAPDGSFSLNQLAVSFGGLKQIDDSIGGGEALRLYIAFASTGFGRDGHDPSDTTPVAAVLARSKDDAAEEAVSFSDSPVGAHIAALFLRGIAGAEVASKDLDGFLTKNPSVIEILLLRLPATHPVFALVSKAEGWEDYLSVRQPKHPRRIARRG
jgi:hypothetical protein